MTENQKTLLFLLKPRFKGMRIATLLKKSGMTQMELVMAAAGIPDVVKFKTADCTFGYKIVEKAKVTSGLAAPREAIPMHALPTYTGEIKRAGAVV